MVAVVTSSRGFHLCSLWPGSAVIGQINSHDNFLNFSVPVFFEVLLSSNVFDKFPLRK